MLKVRSKDMAAENLSLFLEKNSFGMLGITDCGVSVLVTCLRICGHYSSILQKEVY